MNMIQTILIAKEECLVLSSKGTEKNHIFSGLVKPSFVDTDYCTTGGTFVDDIM